MGMEAPTMSASWKASVPMKLAPTCPVMTTIGTESRFASASAVKVFVAAGPDVTTAHPTLPVVIAVALERVASACS